MSNVLFWLQDRLGWKVTQRDWEGNPMSKRPRWWNAYGKRLVRNYQERQS